MAQQVPMSVVTKGLSYSVPDPKKKGQSINIIKNVDVCVKPGQLLAIMGPSGGGKTTMLNLLAQRITGGERSGEILYNGRPAKEINLKKISNYVMQHDQLLEFLTVEETLLFNAALKLKHLNRKERHDRVERIMAELGLTVCRSVPIGGQFKKGISGGQKKRVSIAVELLDNPSLLFLDEPTSGLDSALAFDVLKILVDLAKNGRTVICTVHQPRSQVFALFDQLLLLSKGEVVYQGPAAEAEQHFASLGYTCPAHFNPADFMLDLLSTKGGIDADGSPLEHPRGHDAETPNPHAQPVAHLPGTTEAAHAEQANRRVQTALTIEPHRDLTQQEIQKISDAIVDAMEIDANGEATVTARLAQRLEATEGGAPAGVAVVKADAAISAQSFGNGAVQAGGVQLEEVNNEKAIQMPSPAAVKRDHPPLPTNKSRKGGLKFEEGGRFYITQDEIDGLPLRFKQSAYAQKITQESQHQLELHLNDRNQSQFTKQNNACAAFWTGLYLWFYEFFVLSYRVTINCMRNPLKTVASLGTNIFFGLVLGGVYFQLPLNNTIDARNYGASLFMITLNFTFAAFSVIPTFPPERALFNRDVANGLYSPSAFYLAKTFAEIPFNHFGPTILAVIFYWMVGFIEDAGRFFTFLLICQVMVWASIGFFLCISAIAPNVDVANLIAPLFFVVFFLVSGFYLSDNAIPAWINWMKYLAFTRYGYWSVMVNQMEGLTVDAIGPDGQAVAQVSVLSQFALEGKDLWEQIGVLFAVGCGYRLLGFLALKYTNRRVGLEN